MVRSGGERRRGGGEGRVVRRGGDGRGGGGEGRVRRNGGEGRDDGEACNNRVIVESGEMESVDEDVSVGASVGESND